MAMSAFGTVDAGQRCRHNQRTSVLAFCPNAVALDMRRQTHGNNQQTVRNKPQTRGNNMQTFGDNQQTAACGTAMGKQLTMTAAASAPACRHHAPTLSR